MKVRSPITIHAKYKVNRSTHNENLGEGSNEPSPPPLREHVWLKGLRLKGLNKGARDENLTFITYALLMRPKKGKTTVDPWLLTFRLIIFDKLNPLPAKWPIEPALISGIGSVKWMRVFDAPWMGH